MSRCEESTFADELSASFGFSGNRRENVRKTNFWKNRVSTAVLFCVAVLMIYYYFGKHAEESEPPKSKRTKRHLEWPNYDAVRGKKMFPRDVLIVPERPNLHLKRFGGSEHRNRGDGGKGSGRGLGRVPMEERDEVEGRSPEPFGGAAEKHLSGSGEVGEGQKAEEETKFISGLAKGLVSSVRLKGIYMQSVSKRGNHLEEKFNYSKEINNLLQRGFGSGVEDGKRSLKKVFKARGAPFKLPEQSKVNPSQIRAKAPTAFSPAQRGLPITIFLDFRPTRGMRRGFNSRKISEAGQLSHEEGGGMIMKLNLYPRKEAPEGRRSKVFERHKGRADERGNKTAKRKSFGWFSSGKTKRTNRPKECSIMGLNPHGKHITARWRDENGDWIHAKRVTVNYRGKKNDSKRRK